MEAGILSIPRRLAVKQTDWPFLLATPRATTTSGVLNIGDGAFDGVSTGKYAGSANGNYLSINAASGFSGNLLDVQIAGVSKFSISSSTITISQNTVFAAGSLTVTNVKTGGGLSVQRGTSASTNMVEFLHAANAINSGSGTVYGCYINPLFQTSGTTSYAGLGVNVQKSVVTSSGAKLLFDLQLTGVSKFSVDESGNTSITGVLTVQKPNTLEFVIGGAGAFLTTGVKGDLVVPFDCTITAVTLLADVTGSAVVDIWNASYDTYPPTVSNTITASAVPTITSANNSTDTTLTGWTTSLTAGTVLRFNINSVSGLSRLAVVLTVVEKPSSLNTLQFVLDGGGLVLTSGIKGDLVVPYTCTLQSLEMTSDVTGSLVVDIWKATYINYPPKVANTITASALPTLSSSNKSTDTTLTGWTTAFTQGDVLRFNINSCTTITKANITLTVKDANGIVASNQRYLEFVINGGGSAITTGIAGDIVIPYGCTLKSIALLADQSGSITLDFWSTSYTNAPPTAANSIVDRASPAISSTNKYRDITLLGWKKKLNQGDVLRVNVVSATTITRCLVALQVSRTDDALSLVLSDVPAAVSASSVLCSAWSFT